MGIVINFEGIHGAGKTTQARLLETALNTRGIDTEYICSVDKPLSRYGMDFLKNNGAQSPETLFYLSLANNFSIQERLEKKAGVIILDRYIYTDVASTLLAGKNIDWINGCLIPFRHPDLSFLIDLSPEEALVRKGGSSSHLENGVYQINEKERGFVNYQGRLRTAYQQIASSYNNVIKLEGSKSQEEIHKEVLEHLEGKIK